MKKLLIILIAFFAFSAVGISQGGERIQSLRIAFITEKLELTPEESQAFWPIYNELQDKMKVFKKDAIRDRNLMNITDEEADALLQKRFEVEQKRLDLKREYFAKLNQVLPSRKLVRLPKAEQQFKRKLLERVKNRRERRGRGF